MTTSPDLREQLLAISDSLDGLVARGNQDEIQIPLQSLKQACNQVGKSWSGSFLGYHAFIYYLNLQPPPPGTHFSQEWGPGDNWIEYDPEQIGSVIRELAGNLDSKPANDYFAEAAAEFDSHKLNALSILEIALNETNDTFLNALKKQIDSLSITTEDKERRRLMPKGKLISRDSLAAYQGVSLPPHLDIIAQVNAVQHTILTVTRIAELTRQSAAHIRRLQQNTLRRQQVTVGIGSKVFVGHGHSAIWRQLKDFIEERLQLEVEEFNRVPTAGISNIERLLQMLDQSAFAFLVMTAEDQQTTGEYLPRMNVVHEAGLFQGRLGFERAIVLLEDGCEEFSNITGLGQIRFTKGDILSRSEEIRMVLEREGVLNTMF